MLPNCRPCCTIKLYSRKEVLSMAKAYTKIELQILWENRFKRNSKQMTELIPERSQRSLKNTLGRLRSVSDEDEDFLLKNALLYPASEIDTIRSLPRTTSATYYLLKGIKHMKNPFSYSKKELEVFHEHKGNLTYKEIAILLNTTEPRIRNMAYNLGIKTKFIWTKELINESAKLLDEGKSIEEVAEHFGRERESILVMLRLNDLYEYIPESFSSKYTASRPELYIMKKLENEFGINFPKKCRENANYYWGIIPPYEVDIPFYINGEKFAIEYNATHWHSDEDRKIRDEEKEVLLKEKGFHYFRFTSDMHKHNNFKSMDPTLDILCQSIREIINIKQTFND